MAQKTFIGRINRLDFVVDGNFTQEEIEEVITDALDAINSRRGHPVVFYSESLEIQED